MAANQILDLPSVLLVGLIGLFAGGIANYIANLLLCEEGVVPAASMHTYCRHRDSLIDALPFFSYLLLNRKCKECKRRAIWQYPLVEIITATIFGALAYQFGLNVSTYGLMFFVSVLVSICVTDFKAKIIPHEITYPAIIIGIIFGIVTRGDVFGALAGIGVSYIFFDFLAFYGLKVYLWIHRPSLRTGESFFSVDRKPLKALKKHNFISARLTEGWHSLAHRFNKKQHRGPHMFIKGIPIEELEVIGGGDAVLSALISAWLGWKKLLVSLISGFLVGTVLGAIYVVVELYRERLLKNIIAPIIICSLCFVGFAASMLFLLAFSLRESILLMPYQFILPGSALIGCLLGIIIAGSRMAKPFPFGPALAIGAIIAIFRQD